MFERPARRSASLIGRAAFIDEIAAAVESRRGYAAGKLSHSHVYRLSYGLIADRFRDRAFVPEDTTRRLHFESLNQLGIFPADLDFYRRFDAFYVEHLRNIDCLGVMPERLDATLRIVSAHGVPGRLVDFHDQEPDRSSPSDESACYLRHFADCKVLIICPFARLLRDRANRELFEGVWAKTGKRWFNPCTVDALEIPYGFATETHRRYGTVLDLHDDIREAIRRHDPDVALIGAGGLGIPIASELKRLGRIGIELGGHLQILFGVIGKRWRGWSDWQARYFNEHWIDMPESYRPRETDVCDRGAYW